MLLFSTVTVYCSVASGMAVGSLTAIDDVERSPVGSRSLGGVWEKKVGCKLELVPEADEIVRRTLEHIDKKRAALKLPVYDPNKFGQSGDDRMIEWMEMPAELQAEALYGELVPA